MSPFRLDNASMKTCAYLGCGMLFFASLLTKSSPLLAVILNSVGGPLAVAAGIVLAMNKRRR